MMNGKRLRFVIAYVRRVREGQDATKAARDAAREVGYATSMLTRATNILLKDASVIAEIAKETAKQASEKHSKPATNKRAREDQKAAQAAGDAARAAEFDEQKAKGRGFSGKSAYIRMLEDMAVDAALTASARMRAMEMLGRVMGHFKPSTFDPIAPSGRGPGRPKGKAKSSEVETISKTPSEPERDRLDTPVRPPEEDQSPIAAAMKRRNLH